MSGLGEGFNDGTLRFSRIRGRMNENYSLQYPSPFFDVAQTYLPATVKQMFRWCRYYFLVNPLINAVVFKMAEYPVTDVIFDADDEGIKELWKHMILEHLRYRAFQVETGLDYYTYGNAMVSIYFPFVKMLECRACKFKKAAKDAEYAFRNYDFIWVCPKCGHHAPAQVVDHYVKAPRGIRLLRWNPEDIDVRYNDLNGQNTYYYEIPVPLKSDITMGKKAVIETIPQLFIEAMKQKKAVVFSKDNFFHFKRPSLAGKDRGWGTPMILPVMKDTFYLQILRKAQEAIMLEHIVPLRILFPQAGSATSDPYTNVNLAEWRDKVGLEIRKWRVDNNYMPIMPLPIGHQTIGGDGRALLLTQELRVWSEQIVAGMGIPNELIFGGMSYSGSNVSLRMLENMFLGYLQDHLALLRWTIRSIADYLDWPVISSRFKPFKMADDLQRKAYLFQLNQAGKLSDESLLADVDHDSVKEDRHIMREAERRAEAQRKSLLAQAETQGEAQMIQMRWQMKAQTEQMKAQTAIQMGAAKEQMALQTTAQNYLLSAQTAAQQGQPPPPPPPELQSAPTDPNQLMPPREIQSPLTLQSAQPIPPGTTGESLSGKTNVDLLLVGKQAADYITNLDPISRTRALANLKQTQPEMYDVVLGIMGSSGLPKGPTQAARPLPQERAPRRGPESTLI